MLPSGGSSARQNGSHAKLLEVLPDDAIKVQELSSLISCLTMRNIFPTLEAVFLNAVSIQYVRNGTTEGKI